MGGRSAAPQLSTHDRGDGHVRRTGGSEPRSCGRIQGSRSLGDVRRRSRSSAELAAGLVGHSVELLVTSVKERQRSLLSGWQGDDAGTEEMRIAVQHYRTFWSHLEDFSREV
jgi:hypothetical protein